MSTLGTCWVKDKNALETIWIPRSVLGQQDSCPTNIWSSQGGCGTNTKPSYHQISIEEPSQSNPMTIGKLSCSLNVYCKNMLGQRSQHPRNYFNSQEYAGATGQPSYQYMVIPGRLSNRLNGWEQIGLVIIHSARPLASICNMPS